MPACTDAVIAFVSLLEASLQDLSFQKLTLGNFKGQPEDLEHIYVRLIVLKKGVRLSFLHRHTHSDQTSSYLISEGLAKLRDWIGVSSLAATLLTNSHRYQLICNRKGKPRLVTSRAEAQEDRKHDRSKTRLLRDEAFLWRLGILGPDGKPKTHMGDKYRQIHQFIEILAPALRFLSNKSSLRVIDMGAGKGYLTFALYSFLDQEGFHPNVLGIEARESLVSFCNSIAGQCAFNNLRFQSGEISTVKEEKLDVLVALHACDTATDDALFYGVRHGTELILAAPCCHRELRPQIVAPPGLEPLFRYGIQQERMSEAITDSLRVMFLQASGYKSRIQEFVAVEHTMKNLLIMARKNSRAQEKSAMLNSAKEFQALFSIKHQRLGDLLRGILAPDNEALHPRNTEDLAAFSYETDATRESAAR
ncbi:MAG: SAM-dependent methyltransferase [Verrucomicrobia bacterium]|nr:SAM-dependent methyltransferase [Verrucomicrobiota bacterium]